MKKMKCSSHAFMLMWALVVGLVSQNLLIPTIASTLEDQKNYYAPDPHARSPPTGSHGSPSPGSTPSYGSGGTPPSHGHGGYTPSTPTPSHGHGGYTPSTPTPSHGHGGYTPSTPTPSTPSGGNCGTPPNVPTPSNPTSPRGGGGGGYYPSPPTPPTPVIVSPPATPTTPFVPTPPFVPDPNSPFSCNYWRNHPGIIWGLFGWWGTLGSAFGVTTLPGIGASMSLQQALSNTRTDGYGVLYREGTASLLNAMVSNRFPLTSRQVRESFIAALASNKAAAAQGQVFKQANEGRLKP